MIIAVWNPTMNREIPSIFHAFIRLEIYRLCLRRKVALPRRPTTGGELEKILMVISG
jgi:hypothetical protein